MSWVIKDGFNGVVFDWAEEGSCKSAIGKMLTEDTYAGRDQIRESAGGGFYAG